MTPPMDSANDRQADRERPYWVEITGRAAGTNRYSWEQLDDTDTTIPPVPGAFAMSGTSDAAGWPAYEVEGRADVPAGAKVLAHVSASGKFWWFRYGGDPAAGCDADACDDLVGLKETDCVKLSLLCHEGEFSGMGEEQFAAVFGWYEEYSAGLFGWVFYVWDSGTSAWVEFDMDWIGGSGGVVLTFATDGTPQLTVDGTLEMFFKPCVGGAKFVGGQRNGFTGDTPPEGCEPNVFVLKVECSCCPIDGWQGDAYYCVEDTGPSDCYAVELREENGDHCDDGDPFVICSGPYDTLELAQAACPPAPPPIETGCCPANPVPQSLTATVTSGGAYDGTYALTYRSGVWSFILDDGAIGSCGAGGTEAILVLQCNGSNQWEFYTDDFVFGPFAPTSDACDPFSVVFDNVNFSLCGLQTGATVTVTA